MSATKAEEERKNDGEGTKGEEHRKSVVMMMMNDDMYLYRL